MTLEQVLSLFRLVGFSRLKIHTYFVDSKIQFGSNRCLIRWALTCHTRDLETSLYPSYRRLKAKGIHLTK